MKLIDFLLVRNRYDGNELFYFLILNDRLIRNMPIAINIDAKIRMIISFNNRISIPMIISPIPNFKRALEPCFLIS